MVRVRKSPNMMSTTGRKPVIAAPTPIPLNPASEIGVSRTRSAPNSSTSPERTLNGVPASATSSPKMQTRESRRISSARASRTACANVSSRSGINVLIDLIDAGIRCIDGEFHRGFCLAADLGRDSVECGGIRVIVFDQPLRMNLDRIAIRFPVLLFVLRTVIFAIDIADMMTGVAVSVGLKKRWTFPGTRTLHQVLGDRVDGANILPVHSCRFDSKGPRTTEDRSRGRLAVMRVLVVEIVLANIDHGQFPKLREIHDLV